MGDLIDRDDTLAEIKRIYCTGCNDYRGTKCRACEISDTMDVVEDMPTVDAEPVRRGEWLVNGIALQCPLCKKMLVVEQADEGLRYCPFCGAKMKEEVET